MELNKEQINLQSEEDKKKEIFYKNLHYLNHSLDIIRNRIFNLILSNIYVKTIDFDFEKTFQSILNNINNLDKEVIEMINNMNLKFGEVGKKIDLLKNEINKINKKKKGS